MLPLVASRLNQYHKWRLPTQCIKPSPLRYQLDANC